jgi:hypothetical protein
MIYDKRRINKQMFIYLVDYTYLVSVSRLYKHLGRAQEKNSLGTSSPIAFLGRFRVSQLVISLC